MTELRDFLLACIEADEARVADEWFDGDHRARWLAECAAKRRIVAAHEPRHDEGFSVPMCGTCDESWPCDTMAALATVYADQPGFDARWGM